MDRAMVEEQLAVAERHAAEAEKHVARQREVIAEMEQDAADTALAKALLVEFERLGGIHIAERDRLRKMLADKV
jgi:hypothetical protein